MLHEVLRAFPSRNRCLLQKLRDSFERSASRELVGLHGWLRVAQRVVTDLSGGVWLVLRCFVDVIVYL